MTMHALGVCERASLRLMPAARSTVYAMPDRLSKGGRQPKSELDDEEWTASEAQQEIVLIAEDEETIAETLSLIVEDAGFTALVARNGREALALARQHHPQLIITDLMMPYLNGADLIAAVRTDAESQGLAPPPVIVVTAASPRRAEEAGADVVIVKPFDVTKVEAAMRQFLPDEHR